jgi:hypothetical protein
MTTPSKTESIYNLINPVTKKVLKRKVSLSPADAMTSNYAFALNSIDKKYVKVS